MPSSTINLAAILERDADINNRNEAARNRLEDFRTAYLQSIPLNNFDHALWHSVEIESATVDKSLKHGTAIYTMIAPPTYCNFTHNVMGGAIATILDGLMNCTIALIARKGIWEHGGVSRSANISYIRPVACHAKLHIQCTILRANHSSVTIQGVMKRADDGKELAICMQEFVALSKSKL